MESRIDLRQEIGNASIHDYWHGANQALKEQEAAVGGRDYLDVDDELFRFVNTDGIVAEK